MNTNEIHKVVNDMINQGWQQEVFWDYIIRLKRDNNHIDFWRSESDKGWHVITASRESDSTGYYGIDHSLHGMSEDKLFGNLEKWFMEAEKEWEKNKSL